MSDWSLLFAQFMIFHLILNLRHLNGNRSFCSLLTRESLRAAENLEMNDGKFNGKGFRLSHFSNVRWWYPDFLSKEG